jgi:predicted TIM-barrel fold metal-dependent hydrolase
VRGGFKVFDTDTHTRPSLETLDPYFDAAMRAKLPGIEPYKRISHRADEGLVPGTHSYAFPGQVHYRRMLGSAGADPGEGRPPKNYQGSADPTVGAHDGDPDARLQDMDREGVDVQLLIGGGPNPVELHDVALHLGFMQAYTRFLNDFCGRDPHRLKAVIPVNPYAVEESVAEIKRWGDTQWMVGVYPIMYNDTPMDHPDLEPIWRAVDELGLAVIHHSHYGGPPHFPGYFDLWDNVFLARSASHPWGAMRAVGSFIGSGILERYRNLRFGILESCCGWLPFWMRRLDDQAQYVGGVPRLQRTIGEQMTAGRFFSSIEMAEGQDMIRTVIDYLGPDVLMYASDYPHLECRFPDSVDYFLSWTALDDEIKRKMLWDNPVRFYGEP